MFKKLLLVLLLSTSLVLTSCGNEKLGTFQEELAKEQTAYTETINKYFSDVLDFSLGKFSTDGNVKVELDVVDKLRASINYGFKGNSIIDENNLSFDGNLDFGLNANISDKTKDPNLAMFAGNKGSISSDIKIGIIGNTLFGSLKDLKFNLDDFKQGFGAMIVAKVEEVKENFAGKMFSFDLGDDQDFSQVVKSISKTTETLNSVRELLVSLFNGNVLKEGKQTTYDGKDAYSFEIDEAVLKANLKNIYENNITKIIENTNKAKDKEAVFMAIDKLKVKSSEGYLVRSGDNGVNLVLKKLVLSSEDSQEEMIIGFEVLDKEINFNLSKNPKTNLFNLSLDTSSDSKISYKGSVKSEDTSKEIVTFNGNIETVRKGDSLDSSFDIDLMLKDMPQVPKGVEIKLDTKSSTKKDDSINITRESIVGDEKIYTQQDLQKMLFGVQVN